MSPRSATYDVAVKDIASGGGGSKSHPLGVAPFVERDDPRRFTDAGIEIAPLYTGADLPGDAAGEAPGRFPFTRGIHPHMYRERLWTMRQYAGYGSAAESNARYRYLLAQGSTGLSMAFDLPTQLGLDSDDPRSEGEVGRTGVAIDTLEDMREALAGIPLAEVSTSMTINAPAAVLLSLYELVGSEQGVPRVRLRGTVQNDILKEYVARGNYIYPPQPSMRLTADVIAHCARALPRFHPISISGYHLREQGCSVVQEVAFTLANAIAYVQAALDAGLKVDAIGPQLSFFFNAHNDLFAEVAKFRAARRMWALIMRDRFGAREPASMMLRFHTQTAGVTLTAQQPLNNVVRVALQALAAVCGGTQSLHTNAYDEALALPSQLAARTALRTQQVIAHETGVASTVDPFAGSYFVEALTREVEQEAQRLLTRVDELGGAVAAIGFVTESIEESAWAYAERQRTGRDVVVGVNAYEDEQADVPATLRVDPGVQRRQVQRLARWRAERDGALAQRRLDELRAGAQGSGPLMGLISQAMADRCTVGEVCGVMREVFGEYRP